MNISQLIIDIHYNLYYNLSNLRIWKIMETLETPNYQELIDAFVEHDIRGHEMEQQILKKAYEIIKDIHGTYPIGSVTSRLYPETTVELYGKNYTGYINVKFDYPLIQPQSFEIPFELFFSQKELSNLIERKNK